MVGNQCPFCAEKSDEIKRLQRELKVARGALGFASSVIKSGEPWTTACEEVIGGALYNFPPGRH